MTAPNELYKVRVGNSLLHKDKSSTTSTEFHTLQYTDKDTVKGQKTDAQVTLFGSGAVELEFTNESEQRLNCRGLLQPANALECVLVFDPATQSFTIEKLASRGTQLRASKVRTKKRELPSSKRSTLIAPSAQRLRSTAKALPTREPHSAANRRRSALEAAARKLSVASSQQPSPLKRNSATIPVSMQTTTATSTTTATPATAGIASRSAAAGGVVLSSNAIPAPSARYAAAAATSALPFRSAAATGKDAPLVARLSQSYNDSSSSSSESDMDAYNESSSEED